VPAAASCVTSHRRRCSPSRQRRAAATPPAECASRSWGRCARRRP
jgi:hypothetical protein